MQKHHQPLSVRFPIEIYEAVKDMAIKEHRSISQQIVIFVERGIEQHQNQSA